MESRKRILGIEGGGTKTEWVLLDGDTLLQQGSLAASNLRLASDEALARLFSVLPSDATHVGTFLAGCATEGDRARLLQLVKNAWPGAQHAVGGDRESGFATAFGAGDGILVIGGTGSAVTGRCDGRMDKAGGWGQLLGDLGGGYTLAVEALRLTLFNFDCGQQSTELSQAILRALSLNHLSDLSAWVATADKMSVAKLAPVVFAAAKNGDGEMAAAIQEGARKLVEYTLAVARRLGMDAPEVKLMGGLFVHHPEYADLFRDYLGDSLPRAQVGICAESGALGAAQLAAGVVLSRDERGRTLLAPDASELAAAPTEQTNPRSVQLDQLSAGAVVDLFVAEESHVTAAIAACREPLAQAIDLVSAALRSGGRLFYIGAGTSGRLGMLDASEIPPTFGAPPEMVQGIMAGGVRALYQSVEGAEDEAGQGALALLERGVRAGDVVCGIAASGRTPFVLGALARAREVGAQTILLTCNPSHPPVACDVVIALPTGPEIVTGSTRLKAGTATKLALNILSTAAMVRLGRVSGNRMTHVAATNAKLRERAARIVGEARGCSHDEAMALLARHGWDVAACL